MEASSFAREREKNTSIGRRFDMESATEIRQKIDEQLADIEKLPAMPSVVQKIVVLATDPDADIHKLSDEISKDTGITAGVIRLSNSAYYRPQKPVRSV